MVYPKSVRFAIAFGGLILSAGCATFPSQPVHINGRSLSMYTASEGTPVVVFENGLGESMDTWRKVLPEVACFTKGVAYDRAGAGSSPAGPEPRDAHAVVADLHKLLARCHIEPPYILVAHSIGGLYARMYAYRYPEEVAGLVLADPSPEDWDRVRRERISPESVRRSERLVAISSFLMGPGARAEWDARGRTENQVREARRALDIPVAVLSAGKNERRLIMPKETARKTHEIALELHKKMANESVYGTHETIQDAGHMMQRETPEAIVDAVREMVEAIRESEDP